MKLTAQDLRGLDGKGKQKRDRTPSRLAKGWTGSKHGVIRYPNLVAFAVAPALRDAFHRYCKDHSLGQAEAVRRLVAMPDVMDRGLPPSWHPPIKRGRHSDGNPANMRGCMLSCRVSDEMLDHLDACALFDLQSRSESMTYQIGIPLENLGYAK